MSLVTPRVFWPVVIDSTNDDVRFTHAASGTGTFNGTVAHATYTSPEDLMDAVVNGFRLAVDGGPTAFQDIGDCFVTYSISTSGVITLNWTFEDMSTPLGIKWGQSTSHQALATLLGFPTANTDYTVTAGSPETATAIGTSQMQHYWTPRIVTTANQAVRSDTLDRNHYSPTVVETAGGQNKTTVWGSARVERSVAFEFLPPHKIFTARESTYTNQALERIITTEGTGKIRYWADDATLGTYGDYFLARETIERITRAERMFDGLDVYRLTLDLRGYNP